MHSDDRRFIVGPFIRSESGGFHLAKGDEAMQLFLDSAHKRVLFGIGDMNYVKLAIAGCAPERALLECSITEMVTGDGGTVVPLTLENVFAHYDARSDGITLSSETVITRRAGYNRETGIGEVLTRTTFERYPERALTAA